MKPSEKKVSITVLFGTDVVKYGDKPTHGYNKKTYTFNNEREKNIFLHGIDEANGWLEYAVLPNNKEGLKCL